MIHDKETLKQYISVSGNFLLSDFEMYLKKANREFLKKYVGNLYNDIDDLEIDVDLKETVTDLVHTAIANFAYFLSTPFNSITMDGSGMANVTTQNRTNITMYQMNDIRRELLRSAHSAMDELLEVLEANPVAFPTWYENYSTIYNQYIVNSTAVFQTAYNIHNSRQTYLALQPSIQLVEDKLLNTTFCADLLADLKKTTVSPQAKALKNLLAKAVVNATVAKVCAEGVFEITSTGIKIKFDALPYEQITALVMNDQLKNKIANLNANADQYLKMAVDYIKENNTLFTQCNGKPIIEKTSNGYKQIITKSILGL